MSRDISVTSSALACGCVGGPLPFARIDVGREGSADSADRRVLGDVSGFACRWRGRVDDRNDAGDESGEQRHRREQDDIAVLLPGTHGTENRQRRHLFPDARPQALVTATGMRETLGNLVENRKPRTRAGSSRWRRGISGAGCRQR